MYFICAFLSLCIICNILIFHVIYSSRQLTLDYEFLEFNITNALTLNKIKYFYIVFFIASRTVLLDRIYEFKLKEIFKAHSDARLQCIPANGTSTDLNLQLIVGNDVLNNTTFFIPEKGLYQNILITGTTGSRQNKCCNLPIY